MDVWPMYSALGSWAQSWKLKVRDCTGSVWARIRLRTLGGKPWPLSGELRGGPQKSDGTAQGTAPWVGDVMGVQEVPSRFLEVLSRRL